MYANAIPFRYFTDLVVAISSVEPKKMGTRSSGKPSRQARLLQRWIQKVKKEHATAESPLPPGTLVIFFRLLFPEEGVRRRYGMQEQLLGGALEKYLRVKEGRFNEWCAPTLGQRSVSSGCLGTEVQRYLEGRGRCPARKIELTLGRVDELLDEMASLSNFSAAEVRDARFRSSVPRDFPSILKDLLDPLTESQIAIMIQLILRDLSPILYPPPSLSGDVALREFSSAAYTQVTVLQAMREWHSAMPNLYRVVADLDYVSNQIEEALRDNRDAPKPCPRIGVPIKVPKTDKPGSCVRACNNLRGRVAVETKYDGERLQVHVDMALPRLDQVKIFSKSGRDSTATRHLLVPIIRASLGMDLHLTDSAVDPRLAARSKSNCRGPSFLQRVILEGEMVPFDEGVGGIEEFWKLADAKAGHDISPTEDDFSQNSFSTGATTPPGPDLYRYVPALPDLHLKVVWFDALLVDDESLLDQNLEHRRARLVNLVREIPGYSKLADFVDIDFNDRRSALSDLRLRFAHIIAARAEGLMLKPLESKYNDWRAEMRWVKLKKDFIPGAGDTIDVFIVGASWQKKRGRELLVPPSMYTTFYVGLREESLGAHLGRQSKPHYHIGFTTSYGLDRGQLARLCHNIRERQPQRFDPTSGRTTFRTCDRPKSPFTVYESTCTNFTFSLAEHLAAASTRPSIIFAEPRIFELNGAGFQRAHRSPFYELRWPRVTKVDRLDGAPLTLQQLQETATKAMRLVPSSAATVVDLIWRTSYGPLASETSEEKYHREVAEWVGKLEAADHVSTKESSPLSSGRMTTPKGRPHLAELRTTTNIAPSSSSNVNAKAGSSSREPFFKGVVPNPFRLRIGTTLIHIDTSPSASPSSVPRDKPFSAPLPSPQTSPQRPLPPSLPLDPAPAVTNPQPTTKRPADTSTTPSSPTPLKRPRSSYPTLTQLHTVAPSSELDLTLPPRTPRRRSSAPSTSISATWTLLHDANDRPAFPSSTYAWSLHPSLPASSALPHPRHPFLDSTNHFRNPLDVLWTAGWLPMDRTVPYEGTRRQGFVFVEKEEEVQKLMERRGTVVQGRGERKTVWIVERKALEERGHWDLGPEVLCMF